METTNSQQLIALTIGTKYPVGKMGGKNESNSSKLLARNSYSGSVVDIHIFFTFDTYL